MQVLAPAKINLSLKILGRRNDGFHELDTLIAAISLYDEITIDKGRPSKGIEFRCDDPSVPDWAAEVATPLPCCLRSTTCLRRNYRGKRSPKLRRRLDQTFHFFFFNPQPYAKGMAKWSCP
jgi:4-diphosphocytidyl-2C-methyl-D-erythritol kinase